ncbi:MAG TPA: helix-turn-helix transcriptional regulator [Candidatus Kapabacteria bacterium]|nr:helix-turn-helix transcriptional regulator [Candidatus Kapabacteria bacterium]
MNIRKIIGSNIRDLRIIRGFSQKELAKRSHRHTVYISSVERGERNITVENLVSIAEALNIPSHLLLIENAFLKR